MVINVFSVEVAKFGKALTAFSSSCNSVTLTNKPLSIVKMSPPVNFTTDTRSLSDETFCSVICVTSKLLTLTVSVNVKASSPLSKSKLNDDSLGDVVSSTYVVTGSRVPVTLFSAVSMMACSTMYKKVSLEVVAKPISFLI